MTTPKNPQTTSNPDREAGGCCGPSPCLTDYAYASIEEFEEIVGYKVNDAFKDGWRMARTTNAMLGILSNNSDG
jgi:hypothetical protein